MRIVVRVVPTEQVVVHDRRHRVLEKAALAGDAVEVVIAECEVVFVVEQLIEVGGQVGLGLEPSPELADVGRREQDDPRYMALVVVRIGVVKHLFEPGQPLQEVGGPPVHPVVPVGFPDSGDPVEAARAPSLGIVQSRLVPIREDEDLAVEDDGLVRLHVTVYAQPEEHLAVPASLPEFSVPSEGRETPRNINIAFIDVPDPEGLQEGHFIRFEIAHDDNRSRGLLAETFDAHLCRDKVTAGDRDDVTQRLVVAWLAQPCGSVHPCRSAVGGTARWRRRRGNGEVAQRGKAADGRFTERRIVRTFAAAERPVEVA
ncbi:MAG TPA: hypothetical protein VHX67_08340 [Acidimicrobiales bacterium]|nr:hypothetical protein [Acidimicrobiales bacterium]